MKLFTTNRISELDKFTIENEPISSVDLMERASSAFVDCFLESCSTNSNLAVFCGPGNNGGDGLVIARLLSLIFKDSRIAVYVLDLGKGFSPSFEVNLKRLKEQGLAQISVICSSDQFPFLDEKNVIIDALFGAGLNRPLDGVAAALVQTINQSGAVIYAVDIPSGLMGEDNRQNISENCIRAKATITFQFPKLSFLLSENEKFVGDWKVVDIGLHQKAIQEMPHVGFYLEKCDVERLIKPRTKFSHKGTYGHALLIAGSYGKMGAAILSSKACLRSGVGLLTTHVPHNCYQMLQTAVPEVMCEIDESDLMFTGTPNLTPYSAIGIGPAISTKVNAQRGFHKLIQDVKVPLVIDADGLNILSQNLEWVSNLPEKTIITPHPKEFDRIAGDSQSGYERLQKARDLAQKHKLIVVLKGAHTQIVNTNGDVWFNSTGNPGMATAGSGDVLTGVILSLLAQGYLPDDAAKIGVFVHGMAGDFASEQQGQTALLASDIINNLGRVYEVFRNNSF